MAMDSRAHVPIEEMERMLPGLMPVVLEIRRVRATLPEPPSVDDDPTGKKMLDWVMMECEK